MNLYFIISSFNLLSTVHHESMIIPDLEQVIYLDTVLMTTVINDFSLKVYGIFIFIIYLL